VSHHAGHEAAPGRPASARLADGACLVFAAWTLSVHVVVLLGGSLHHAMGAFAVALAAGAAGWIRLQRRRPASGPPLATEPPPFGRRQARLQAGAFGIALVGALWLQGDAEAFWWWSLVVLLAALGLFVLPEPPVAEAPARGRGLEIGLWGLAAAGALLALAAHRFDLDDAFYVNLAVAAADAPSAPLLAGDTLHGVAGLPIQLPVYRVHSYEPWNAALSWLSGIPVIACFHWVSAALGAVLAPLALARLARLLTPRHWLWTVAATLFVLLAAGDVHRWYGNFAFVRLWQGKGLFLFVFLPLIQAYAIELALRPGAAGFVRLSAAQVAAVGCTSTALWAAPAGALAAAACALRPGRTGVLRLGLVLTSSLYLFALGWGLRGAILESPSIGWVAEHTPEMEWAREQLPDTPADAVGADLEAALALVVGSGALRAVCLVSLVVAWALRRPGLARRYAVVVPLAVAVVLLDPYTTGWVARNLTGASFWRVLWVLPLPLLLALVLTAPLQVPVRPGWLRHGAVVAACAAFGLAVPVMSSLSADNGVVFGWPRLKVPPESWRWAQILTERAGPGVVALAPADVSAWLPTFHDRVYPLVVRPFYLNAYVEQLGEEDLQLRMLMVHYVGGTARNPDAAPLFAAGLERFGVGAVLLRREPGNAGARALLRRAGFRLDLESLGHEIWLRR
jgi:hypothetical protein